MKGWVIMRKITKGNKAILSILLCFALAVPSSMVYAKSTVRLNKKSTTIQVGKTVQLKINGTKKKVSWSSSNKKVATVTNKGKVKGIKAGKATITAKVEKKKLSCKVVVKNNIVKPTATPTAEPISTPTLPRPKPNTDPTPTPTIKPTVDPNTKYYNIGEEYTTKDNVTMRINVITTQAISENSYTCEINYDLRNNKTNALAFAPSFRIFDEDGIMTNQRGMFQYLYPSSYQPNQYCSFTLNAKPLVLEFQTNQKYNQTYYPTVLNPDEFHWKLSE